MHPWHTEESALALLVDMGNIFKDTVSEPTGDV